jgi:hypothetical protein
VFDPLRACFEGEGCAIDDLLNITPTVSLNSCLFDLHQKLVPDIHLTNCASKHRPPPVLSHLEGVAAVHGGTRRGASDSG